MFFAGRIFFRFGSAQVSQEGGSDELVVDELRSVKPTRKEAPNEENAFQHPVERYESKNEVGEEFQKAHSSEHHPVGQPDGVVFFVSALDRQDGRIGRVCKSDSVADELCAVSYDDHGGQEEAGPED